MKKNSPKHRQPRSSKRLPPTPENVEKRQAIFLAAYAECGTIRTATAMSGVARSMHWEWLANSPGYAEKFEAAKAESVEMLEDEARRRAHDGIRKRKFHPRSKRAYDEIEYSDVLLIVLLKANAPEKYRERFDSQVNATVAHSGQVMIQLPATEPNE